jgi:hypothetical protein
MNTFKRKFLFAAVLADRARSGLRGLRPTQQAAQAATPNFSPPTRAWW